MFGGNDDHFYRSNDIACYMGVNIMSDDGWTSKPEYNKVWIEEAATVTKQAWDLAKPNSDKSIIWHRNSVQGSNLKSQGSNLMDKDSYLYFQCDGCQSLFDPHTRSFKILNEARHNAGWKIKWNSNGQGYKVYCVICEVPVE